jgi:Icc protein
VTVRILQLTDLHLGPGLDDTRWAAFDRLISDLPTLTGDFDRLVLTGDLAAHGQPAVYRALRTRLGPYLAKLRLVPGNHDDGRLLRQTFSDRMLNGSPATNFLDDVGGVRLLGLDSSRPWRVSGALGRAQLDWLSSQLDPVVPSLLFLHHPPLTLGTWWLDKDCLRDRKALAAVIQDRCVQGVFCGHVHQEAEGRLGAVPVWTTPSTAYQFKPRSLIPRTERRSAGVRVIEITAGVVKTSVVRLS